MASTRTTTIPTWPEARRVPEAARIAAFLGAVLLLEAVLARGVVSSGISRPALLLAGVGALALVFRFPLATAVVMLGLTDFLFYPTFFQMEVGSLSIRPHELALAGLFLVALVRPRRRSWGGGTGIALAAFLAILLASSGLALLDGRAALTDVFNWGRPFAPLSFFYVVVRLFPRPEQRRQLLTAGAILAALTGVVAVFVALGAGFGHSLTGGGETIIKEEEGAAGLLRVRLAGLSLAYALFWYVVVRITTAKVGRRAGWSLLLAGMALAVAISFNRNMWLGLIAGLALMMVVGGSFVRGRLLASVAVAVAGVLLLATFGSATESRVLEPVVKRGSTLFNPGRVEASRSLTDRERETRIAWPEAKRHPVLGIGPGVEFGVFNYNFVGPHSIKAEPQLFLHNQYLYLLLICGVPGLIAFVIFLGTPIVRSFRRSPTDPAITACGVGLAMIMISSIVAIYFSVEDMTAVLGLLTGVIVADSEGRGLDRLDAGLS
ncbi:MAG TPA: O-antigen ligase family protein [Solirubrobacterales bacterium]|nr:O-antigen ligase family protein [Solirubrobacterales bacterium]